jgi:hypothetical protein
MVWVLLVIALIVVGIVAWQVQARRKTSHLQDRFGPEYDRVAGSTHSRRDAEAELSDREKRRDELDIKPLPEGSRERYLESWREVQAQFVDDPRGAIGAADSLLQSVMAERGYPVEDFDQRAADVSVDHPDVVQNYREGHRLAEASRDNGSSTEDLRRALQHYRALFEQLVGSAPGTASAERERTGQ